MPEKDKETKRISKKLLQIEKKNSIIGILELVVAFNGNRNKHSEI